jgi:hypothetical protein
MWLVGFRVDNWRLMMDVNEIEAAKVFRQSLLKKRDEYRQGIIRIDSLLEEVNQFIGDMADTTTTSSVIGGNGDKLNVQAESTKTRPADVSLAGLTRREAAPVVVRAAGNWVTAREILESMGKGGLDTTAKTALLSLYPVLEGHPELQSVTGKGGKKLFGLREWERPKDHNGKPARRSLKRRWRRRNGVPSMGDAAEKVLSEKQPLHADDLWKAVLSMGVDTTKKNMLDGMRRDTRQRFKNLGGNIWTLQQGK